MTTALEVFGSKTMTAGALARRMMDNLKLDSPDESWIIAESQFREFLAFAREMLTFCRELDGEFQGRFAGRLRNRGDIALGNGDRFYAAKVTETKAVEGGHWIFDHLYEEVGGDTDLVKRCLSDGKKTWKHSEIREVAPGLHKRAFKTEIKYHPKTGKPLRKPALTR